MKIKQTFDLIDKVNTIAINKRDIMRDAIPLKDLEKIIYVYKTEPIKIKGALPGLLFEIMKDLEKNFSQGLNVYNDVIFFINSDKLDLPAYYNQVENNIICNFVKPIPYMTNEGIFANILYSVMYYLVLKYVDTYSRSLLKVLGNVYSTIILSVFGKKEGIISNLKAVGLLRLVMFKYVDNQLFKHDDKLVNYTKLIDNQYIVDQIDNDQITYYENYIDMSKGLKSLIETLNKLDILTRIDYKQFTTTIYKIYGLNALSIFDTYERIIPYAITLSFSNEINNHFNKNIPEELVDELNTYAILLAQKEIL